MESIIRNVKDIERDERHHLEKVLGRPLTEDQQLIIQVMDLPVAKPTGERAEATQPLDGLPEWCNVYDGLSSAQLAEIEQIILRRADLSRSFE